MKFGLEKVKSERYSELKALFLKELNKHVTLKKKFLRPNNNPFMTKWCKLKPQRSLCLILLRKTKKKVL